MQRYYEDLLRLFCWLLSSSVLQNHLLSTFWVQKLWLICQRSRKKNFRVPQWQFASKLYGWKYFLFLYLSGNFCRAKELNLSMRLYQTLRELMLNGWVKQCVKRKTSQSLLCRTLIFVLKVLFLKEIRLSTVLLIIFLGTPLLNQYQFIGMNSGIHVGILMQAWYSIMVQYIFF